MNATYPERWGERGGLTVWPPRQSDLTPPLCGHLKEHAHAVPPKISWQDFKQPWQLSTPTCEGVFGRKPRGALASALKWAEAVWSTYYNCEKHRVWSLDSSRHLTVTCMLETKCCCTIFQILLVGNHSMEMCGNFFSSCITAHFRSPHSSILNRPQVGTFVNMSISLLERYIIPLKVFSQYTSLSSDGSRDL